MNSDSESLQTNLCHWWLVHKTHTNEPKLLDCQEFDGVNDPLNQVATFTGGEP
jgi:hypothetical protein